MTLRPCLNHPTRLIANGSYCGECKRANERRRGTTTERGYGTAWQRKSQRLTRRVGRCERCGIEHTAANPLTLDHLTAKANGGTDHDTNLSVICRRCNSAKGARAA